MASRLEEASEATRTLQEALVRIGVRTIAELLALWQRLSNAQRADAAAEWTSRAIQLILLRRRQAQEIARAYYRLNSALLTGSIPAEDDEDEPAVVTIGDLRRQFARLTSEDDDDASVPAPLPRAPRPPDPDRESPPVASPSDRDDSGRDLNDEASDDEVVPVDPDRLEDPDEQTDDTGEQEADVVVKVLGSENLRKKDDELDDERPAREIDEQRSKNADDAGSRMASGGARVAMDGGRDELHDKQRRDKGALGWARISTTGTPCGFCAMLISRGPVYKSRESALYGEDGSEFHDNCYCTAIPVFTQEQYDQDPMFDLNHEYQDLWPRVTRGLSGKAALKAWRRFIRDRQKREREQVTAQAPAA